MLAEAFTAQGRRVVISARDSRSSKWLVEMMARNGMQVLALPCDIRRRDQMRKPGNEISAG
jgi:NAD(P)-dependent dehydrogenase (short-subunit alcohol dehydrogenase family)